MCLNCCIRIHGGQQDSLKKVEYHLLEASSFQLYQEWLRRDVAEHLTNPDTIRRNMTAVMPIQTPGRPHSFGQNSRISAEGTARSIWHTIWRRSYLLVTVIFPVFHPASLMTPHQKCMELQRTTYKWRTSDTEMTHHWISCIGKVWGSIM